MGLQFYAEGLSIIFALTFILLAIAVGYTGRKVGKNDAILSRQKEKIEEKKAEIEELEGLQKSFLDSCIRAELTSEQSIKQANEITNKGIEEARQRFAETVEASKASSQAQISQMTDEMMEIRKLLLAHRETLAAAEAHGIDLIREQDFNAVHGITLSDRDIADIEIIQEIGAKIGRSDAIFKLIWTEYIQKPIQAMCKMVGADRTRGIYKITEISTGRMYIGQALDIGTRWKDHCKTGIGIGSTSYMTNKFYKALHKEGIYSFTFEILEEGNFDLNERERFWIEHFNATGFGFNTKIGG